MIKNNKYTNERTGLISIDCLRHGVVGMAFSIKKNVSVENSALEEKANHVQRKLPGAITSLFC